MIFFFFFKQKTAYEMRISDWSSDVCSSDLDGRRRQGGEVGAREGAQQQGRQQHEVAEPLGRLPEAVGKPAAPAQQEAEQDEQEDREDGGGEGLHETPQARPWRALASSAPCRM